MSFLLINLIGIRFVDAYAWDDGAITLAYARTLADNGVFALTSNSETVEGTSTLLLTGLMAFLHSALDLSFDESIRSAQLTAFAWVVLLVLLIFRSLRNAVPDAIVRAMIALLMGSLPMFSTEIFNGMEMSLFAVLLMLTTLAFDARSRLIYLLIPLVLLCRFESIFYLVFAFTLLWCVEPRERLRVTTLGVYVIVVFALLTVLRWLYFDDVLPNPIWAKLNPPYSKGGTPLLAFVRKLQGIEEFISVHSFLLLVSFGLLYFRESWRSRFDLKVLLVLAFAAFALITGPVAGYPGRMSLACLPLLVLIARDTVMQAAMRGQMLVVERGSLRVAAHTQLATLAVAVALAGTHFANRQQFEVNAFTAAFGAHHQGLLPEPFNTLVEGRIQSEQLTTWYGVSPANYRITGTAADRLREQLNLRSLKMMVPDVGGLGLCCDHLAVIDTSLLTNQFLAHEGWDAFNSYLQRTAPDLIEMHDPWSRLSRIYESRFFADHYEPFVWENHLFWIHEQRLGQLLESPRVVKSRITDLGLLGRVRYGNGAMEREYIAGRRANFLWEMHRN